MRILKLISLLILVIAVVIGLFLNLNPFPEAIIFAMIYPILKGYIPPIISGGYKDCPVLPLPPSPHQGGDDDDNTPLFLEPRPAQETFIKLPALNPLEDTIYDFIDNNTISTDPILEENRNRNKIPQQGIGMCCRYTAYDAESVRRTILWYLKVGGRHIDTAELYLNHVWIGEALQIAAKEYGIQRQDIWITTKLWPRHYGENSTKHAISRMLLELQVGYIDMVLLHSPSNQFASWIPGNTKSECDLKEHSPKECRQETWKTLSKIRQQKHGGLIRHLGVSNFNIRQLQELMELQQQHNKDTKDKHVEAVAPIANHQFQYNPWIAGGSATPAGSSSPVQEIFDFCMAHNISVTAWSSFAADTGTTLLLQHMDALTQETLTKIATSKKKGATIAQILLRWAMQKGAIVIPGSSNPKHMRENLNAYNLRLSRKEMEQIDNLHQDESAKNFFVSTITTMDET